MSALARDDGGFVVSAPRAGWRERRGLTLREAEELLDRLEACGVAQREAAVEAEGVTVRWRPLLLRLVE